LSGYTYVSITFIKLLILLFMYVPVFVNVLASTYIHTKCKIGFRRSWFSSKRVRFELVANLVTLARGVVCFLVIRNVDNDGKKTPVGARFFAHVQTGPGPHPAHCIMGTGSFPGGKAAKAWC
jgi:hypothetical protein